MSTKKYLSLAIILITGFVACKKNPSVKPVTNSNVDVYVVGGTIQNIVPSNDVYGYAIVWKNGVATPLTTGSVYSQAIAMAISGTDVYIAGVVRDTLQKSYSGGCYWKNGVLIPVPDAYSGAFIAVNGSDVYLAGYSSSLGSMCFWKNGVPTKLDSCFQMNGMTVEGNDVYVCGTRDISLSGPPSYKSAQFATYWKNGIQVDLPSRNYKGSVATDIAVNSGNVYIAGENGADSSYACFWQNGIVHNLTSQDYTAFKIDVYNNNVYILGLGTFPGGLPYWKNGVLTTIQDKDYNVPVALSMAFQGNDIYLAGYESTTGYDDHATYWKNGEAVRPQ